MPGGVGWYRKNFTLGEEAKGKRIRIDFDGVYMNATVYVNGKEVGTHPYGYTPFSFDITDYISYDKENTYCSKGRSSDTFQSLVFRKRYLQKREPDNHQ